MITIFDFIAECRYADCCYILCVFIVILSLEMLVVVIQSVNMLTSVLVSVAMLTVVLLCAFMLTAVLLCVVMVSVVMLNVAASNQFLLCHRLCTLRSLPLGHVLQHDDQNLRLQALPQPAGQRYPCL